MEATLLRVNLSRIFIQKPLLILDEVLQAHIIIAILLSVRLIESIVATIYFEW